MFDKTREKIKSRLTEPVEKIVAEVAGVAMFALVIAIFALMTAIGAIVARGTRHAV